MGELVEVTEGVDATKENPEVDEDDELKEELKENPEEGEDDELKEEPNGDDLLGCQLESPNTEELVPLLELTGLASKEEAGALCPEVVPALKMLVVAEFEEGNNELPEEKAVFPVNPNNGDDADEPNATD